MSDKARDILIIIAMLLAYGLVGRMDYDAAVVDHHHIYSGRQHDTR